VRIQEKVDMKMKCSVCLLAILACGIAGAVVEPGSEICAQIAPSLTPQGDVTIPLEVVNGMIFLQVQVGGSRPYWFALDTGVKYAVIDLAIAKALRLRLGAPVDVAGGGKEVVMGNMLSDSPFSLVGLKDFSQPLFLALPMDDLAKANGHEFAGILGMPVLASEFVIEIDYLSKTLTLHDKMTYQYRGRGQSLPVTFNAAGWPEMQAAVIDGDRPAMEGKFVLDIGNCAVPLILNRPFVESEHFLRSDRHTVPWLEGQGIGGGMDGSVGRVTGLQIGHFLIKDPVTAFSQAANGPFAATESQGNIGVPILEKFTIILDYKNNRVIFEPNARFNEPTDYNRSGLVLEAVGENYRTFRIKAVADDSPASEGGLRVGDTLIAIDGKPVSELSLSELRDKLQRANVCELLVERGGAQIKASLKLRNLI
jgi:PDZ domain/Aspartyl protease